MSGGTNQQKVTLPKFFETALQQQVGMEGMLRKQAMFLIMGQT